MTAMGLFRNMGAAPSQTAHAEIPLFQKPVSSSEPLNGSLQSTCRIQDSKETAPAPLLLNSLPILNS